MLLNVPACMHLRHRRNTTSCAAPADKFRDSPPGSNLRTITVQTAHLRHRLEHRQLRRLGGRAALGSHLGCDGGRVVVLVKLQRIRRVGSVSRAMMRESRPHKQARMFGSRHGQPCPSHRPASVIENSLAQAKPSHAQLAHLHLPAQHRLALLPEGVHLRR